MIKFIKNCLFVIIGLIFVTGIFADELPTKLDLSRYVELDRHNYAIYAIDAKDFANVKQIIIPRDTKKDIELHYADGIIFYLVNEPAVLNLLQQYMNFKKL